MVVVVVSAQEMKSYNILRRGSSSGRNAVGKLLFGDKRKGGGVNRDTELELQKRERVGVLPRGGSHFSKGGGSPLKVGNGISSKGSLMAEVNRSTVIMA